MRYEIVDYQHGDRAHDCEVPPLPPKLEDTRQSSPSTSASDFDPLYPTFLNHACFVFLPNFATISLSFHYEIMTTLAVSMAQCLFVSLFWPRSRCTVFHYLAISKYFTFQLLHKSFHFKNSVSVEIRAYEILHHSSSVECLNLKRNF